MNYNIGKKFDRTATRKGDHHPAQRPTEHATILAIGRALKKEGWHSLKLHGRWKSPDGRVFDPHAAVNRNGELLPAWRIWRDTNELVTTGERP